MRFTLLIKEAAEQQFSQSSKCHCAVLDLSFIPFANPRLCQYCTSGKPSHLHFNSRLVLVHAARGVIRLVYGEATVVEPSPWAVAERQLWLRLR